MSDRLQMGLQRLADRQKAVQSVAVTLRRGTLSTTGVLATVGRTEQSLGDIVGGGQIRQSDKDFIISVADYVLGGAAVEPVAGDLIEILEASATNQYEAAPPSENDRCFRRDEYGIRYRVHTKFLKRVS